MIDTTLSLKNVSYQALRLLTFTFVILTGTVGSWYEKDEAERQAWKAPGVEIVANNIVVEYDYSLVD